MNKDPYKRIARIYDRAIEPSNRIVRQIGLRMHPPHPGMRMIDVGCGTGSNLKLYLEAGCEVHGIDRSPAMLKIAREKLDNNAHIRCGDAANMPYRQSTFDLVTAMLTMHEMPREIRMQVLREIARILKPDGHLLLIDFHAGSLRFPKGWLYKGLTYFFEISAGREHFRNYRDFLKQGGLPGLLRENRFEIKKKTIISGGNLALFLTALRKKIPET